MRHDVHLDDATREALRRASEGSGKTAANAKILLLCDPDRSEGGKRLKCKEIAARLEVCQGRVSRVRARFEAEGLDGVVNRKRRKRQAKRWKANPDFESKLLELLKGPPPDGSAKWSLRDLARRMKELSLVASVSHETVRNALIRLKAIEIGAA